MKKTPDKFLKPYDPISTEDRINELWTKSGYFNPDNLPVEDDGRFLFNKADGKSNTFSMVLPPPNVTGTLHTGHAIMLAIEDIMIRYKRMMGYRTLWIPGTDHAAIATQSKVEKELKKKEGKGKHDLGRQEFLKRVEDFAQNSHDTIVNQIKKMGASIDWSREAFTLDAKRNYAVRYAFKEMYDMGLIYRGHRIVNWDPKGQTTISDDEIVYQEEKTKFYYFKYGPFVIGTARPETKFGDKYVVMHPDDERYQKYKHGEKIDLEWINSHITATVIKDPSIDMAFGTGVMTITPYHSNIDFEIAQKYKLDGEQIIDRYGKLLPIAGEFSGMKISEAREKIVEKLKNKGLLEKEEDYVHQIATAERTGGIIEPQVMDQWFIAVNKVFKTKSGNETTLKKMMSEAVSSGKIKILPERFEKNYFHWIENLHDWCISRQIWYGHRIPVWYKKDEMYVGIEEPKGEGAENF
jgi:valyl-tRNA synthetase